VRSNGTIEAILTRRPIVNAPILAPAAALVAWSLIVLYWVILTRFPALKNAKLDLANSEPGGRYQDLEPTLPAKVNWKSHNYTHLMEQPTLFYATVVILALAGEGTGSNVTLAWAYVGLRVAHSLWQGLVNIIPVRIGLFAASSLCLTVLAINAVRATIL
jgi:hypothetical protein